MELFAGDGVPLQPTRSGQENQMPMDSNLHTSSQPLETKETHSLIGSDKVEGTAVYRSNGERIGKIQHVMIGKQSGKVGYAVMSFGGFMGIGEEFYPLPWSLLTYNPRLEGYEVNISEAQLKGAPKYSTHEHWDWVSRTRTIDDYYKSQPNWMM
jgi:PRC-barrel domain